MKELKIAQLIITVITFVVGIAFAILAFCNLLNPPINLIMGVLLITFVVADLTLKIYSVVFKDKTEQMKKSNENNE